ncbi:MAG: MATE family efflux transporter, partial [Oscillospiraceae bacterium]|nr:MATE family efflux transporter [Oscillospiraceae bacterium]
VFLLLPETLLDAFAASDEMKAIGIPALRIICLTFPLTAVTMMCGYTISGLGSGMVNMISTALRQCVVLLPCMLLLGWLSGIRVIWFAFWVSEAAALAFALYQLRRRMAALPEG